MKYSQKNLRIKNNLTFTFRETCVEDRESLNAFLKQTSHASDYLEHNPNEFKQLKEEGEMFVQACKENESSLLLLLETEGQIIGFASIVNSENPNLTHIGVLGIIIKKTFRNQRLGSVLLEEILSWAKASPLQVVILKVHHSNAIARHLYKGFGFLDKTSFQNESLDISDKSDYLIMELPLNVN